MSVVLKVGIFQGLEYFLSEDASCSSVKSLPCLPSDPRGTMQGGEGGSREGGMHSLWGQLLAVPSQQAGGPPPLAHRWCPAPAWLATGSIEDGSSWCRPGERNVRPKEEGSEDGESACLSVLRAAGSSPFDVPGCPLPSLLWPLEPLLATPKGLGVPQRGWGWEGSPRLPAKLF